MKKYTERMSFSVPADLKARWKAKAKERGISLSELIRRATADAASSDNSALIEPQSSSRA